MHMSDIRTDQYLRGATPEVRYWSVLVDDYSVIIHIHKKGTHTATLSNTNKYRGITLLSVVSKLINKITGNRLIRAAA